MMVSKSMAGMEEIIWFVFWRPFSPVLPDLGISGDLSTAKMALLLLDCVEFQTKDPLTNILNRLIQSSGA